MVRWRIEDDKNIFIVFPLAMKVLIVAKVNKKVGDWAAYVDAVKGQSHDREYMEVCRNGAKLTKKQAEFFFDELAKLYSWRY